MQTLVGLALDCAAVTTKINGFCTQVRKEGSVAQTTRNAGGGMVSSRLSEFLLSL